VSQTGARGIHHVGLAVHDADAAARRYEALLGARVDHDATVPDQGVRAVALSLGAGPLVELLEPTAAASPVGRFLERRGEGMHHVAYRVDDLRAELDRLAADGVRLIDRAPRRGLFGLQVAFVHPSSLHGVLAELVEPADGA
jgi:methylmalonyl-CoA epimerase